jgi:AcrR family transcriptional regulator
MSRPASGVLERRGYHHGNLREALVAAGRDLIAERGPAGFTLVEAVRRAGVSPAAPYRHFKDRDALVAEISRRGFEEFAGRLAEAWGSAGADRHAAFARMGEAYLAFARDEPGSYAAMFTPRPAEAARDPDPAAAGAFAALESAVTRIAGQDANDGLRGLAFQVWALSHGIATLTAAGYFRPPDSRITPEDVLRAGVEALIAGARPAQPARTQARAKPALRRKPPRRKPPRRRTTA